MEKFSYYKPPITNKFPERAITLKEAARIITANKGIKKIVDRVREADGDKAKEIKKELPYVTFSGIFEKRLNEKLQQHSGLLCMDVDGQQVAELKDIVPALMFVSPTGTGQKIVFEIDLKSGKHLDYFFALEAYFKKEHDITIDKACKDVARACWLSHDPNVVLSDKPTVLGRPFLRKYKDLDLEEEYMQPGTRNNNLFNEALSAARQKTPIADVIKEFSQYATADFPLTEIKETIKKAYKCVPKNIPYIRVGVNYFKVITKKDRHGTVRQELKPWNQQTITNDHNRRFLAHIPKYDDFVMFPSNKNHKPIVDGCYNLYAPFNHTPAPGKTTWSMQMIHHIFGDQIEQGLRYMQILYQHPDRSTVILVLVSRENKTGKTTFCNWIHMLFGQNVAQLSSADFTSGFNSSYATKNVLVIEETLLEKKLINEKLKALVTAKYIQVNEKYVTPYKIPFYGKVVLTSNNVDTFAKVDAKETRYFVRKLGKPEKFNANIEDDLFREIPAFLHHLDQRPPVDWSKDRSGFDLEEITNKTLQDVKYESRTWLYKELHLNITDYFNDTDDKVLQVTPTDIKGEWFPTDNSVNKAFIKKVIKEEFELTPSDKVIRYTPFSNVNIHSKSGRPYTFHRDDFVTEENTIIDERVALPF